MDTWDGDQVLGRQYLEEVKARWAAVADFGFMLLPDASGRLRVVGHAGTRPVELHITRDSDCASQGDILFIGHSFSDIPRLIELQESGASPLSAEDAGAIAARVSMASAAPWTAFIESEGGTGGSDVIRVSESDSELDMYLWIDSELAPASIFRFVAGARQDVSALLAAARP